MTSDDADATPRKNQTLAETRKFFILKTFGHSIGAQNTNAGLLKLSLQKKNCRAVNETTVATKTHREFTNNTGEMERLGWRALQKKNQKEKSRGKVGTVKSFG